MTADGTPISWMTLKKGTDVLSNDSTKVGDVGEVIADTQKDIFSGITLGGGLFGTARFVPADLIDTMTADAVHLTISAQEAENLEGYES